MSCLTTKSQREWEEHGETTIQTTFKQHTGGAMGRKDQPGLTTDGRTVALGLCQWARKLQINDLPTTRARTKALLLVLKEHLLNTEEIVGHGTDMAHLFGAVEPSQ